MFKRTYLTLLLMTFCAAGTVWGDAESEANYNESTMPSYILPDPLKMQDGQAVTTAEEWFQKRRPELLDLFSREMYGVMPGVDRDRLQFVELTSKEVLGGKATRKEIRILFDAPNPNPKMTLIVYIPTKATKPVPAFLGLNFRGNQAISDEPDILPTEQLDGIYLQGQDPKNLRGVTKTRWPIETIIDRGYAVATGCYEEIDPDYFDGWKNGVHPLFAKFQKDLADGEKAACITAWAWGYSRALDCLETVPDIDAKRVAVFGLSRLGKTALWAGANDQRFALVISNESGCGGAAISRRPFGETNDFMNRVIPYWFCGNYAKYAADPNTIPFDQHELIALIAPRPVYIASAVDDGWADPMGEFLSGFHADPVYRLLGTDGIGNATAWPEPNRPVGATIHYHIRTGTHDITDYDWKQYLDFADRYMTRK